MSFLDPVWAILGRYPLQVAALAALLGLLSFLTDWGNAGTLLVCCAATLMIWRSEQDQPKDAIEESY